MTTQYVDLVAKFSNAQLGVGETTLVSLVVQNNGAAAVYVQLFNSLLQPVDGDVPVYNLGIDATAPGLTPPGGSFTLTPPALNSGGSGRKFTSGLWIVSSTTDEVLTETADAPLQAWAVVGDNT